MTRGGGGVVPGLECAEGRDVSVRRPGRHHVGLERTLGSRRWLTAVDPASDFRSSVRILPVPQAQAKAEGKRPLQAPRPPASRPSHRRFFDRDGRETAPSSLQRLFPVKRKVTPPPPRGELDLDRYMTRKSLVGDRRNGIREGTPGDKPYGRSEYCGDFFRKGSSVFSNNMNLQRRFDPPAAHRRKGTFRGTPAEFQAKSFAQREKRAQLEREHDEVASELEAFEKRLRGDGGASS